MSGVYSCRTDDYDLGCDMEPELDDEAEPGMSFYQVDEAGLGSDGR